MHLEMHLKMLFYSSWLYSCSLNSPRVSGVIANASYVLTKNAQNSRKNSQKLQPCKSDRNALLACGTTSLIHYRATWQPYVKPRTPVKWKTVEFLKKLADYIYATWCRCRSSSKSYIYATRSLVVNRGLLPPWKIQTPSILMTFNPYVLATK